MTRIKTILLLAVTSIFIITSCASNKEPEPQELEGSVKTEVLEHKGTALGINELPVWVDTYVSTGISGLEKLSDYQGSYCFVGEEIGTNLDAVQTWASTFDVSREIAATVSSRVDSLFTGASSGSPDGDYGTYFENIVKASANATYSGARKINDWWILIRRYDPDSRKKHTDEYRVFVLYTIEKETLDQQVLNMIDAIAAETEGTSDAQKTAINNVKKIMESEGI